MRSLVLTGVMLVAAAAAPAQSIDDAVRSFVLAYLPYAPGSTVELQPVRTSASPGGGYRALLAVRHGADKNRTDQLNILLDPAAGTVSVGFLFPITLPEGGLPFDRLPAFAGSQLPELLQQALGSRARVHWPSAPLRPAGVVPFTAESSTGYGWVEMPMALAGDARYLLVGPTWPLDRDPRAVRREILADATVEWDPGHEEAPVKLVEFSDYECPACKRGWFEIKPVLERAGAEVRHGMVNFPLVRAHPWAFRASVAGVCLYAQNPAVMLDFKETLYSLQADLDTTSVDQAAFAFVGENGLDEQAFRACYMKGPALDTVLHQIETGYRLGVFATPSYFANGEAIAYGDTEVLTERLAAITAAGGMPEKTD